MGHNGGGAAHPLLRAVVALAAGGLLWFSVSVVHPVTPRWVGWVPLPVLGVLGAILCVLAARAPGLEPAVRRFWRRIALAVFGVGSAAASNAWDTLTDPVQPSQRVGIVTLGIYSGCVVVVMWALLRLPVKYGASEAYRLRFGLDTATVVLTAGLFAWFFSFRRLADWNAVTGWSAIPALVVVLLAFAAVLGFVKVALAGFGAVDRRALHLMAAAALGGAAGGAIAPLLNGRPQVGTAHLVVPIALGFAAAAADRQRRNAGLPPPPRRSRAFSVLPYAAVLGTDALLLWISRGDALIRVVAVIAVGLTGLVVARQVLAFADNARLLGQVDTSLRDLQRAQHQLAHQASHDGLTGLANRSLFEDRTRQALRAGAGVHAALVDLDDFKAINDRLGHAVGDALLVAVGERLAGCVRAGDTVARLGGDEFGLLLHGTAAEALAAGERAAAALRQPIRAAGHDLMIHGSIGLAEAAGCPTPHEVLRRADVAMYAAKDGGKGRLARYHEDMDRCAAADAQLAAQLRAALDRDEFFLVYQPVVALPDGRTMGAEALVRWRHPELGPVRPDVFIPAAERTGLIVPLTVWVLRAATRQVAAWLAEHGDGVPWKVGVNVSARDLREPDFAGLVARTLAGSGVPGDRLVLELTETAVFDNGPAAEALRRIGELGVTIALDDFGTGHSSLGLLRTCPVDTLKVDKTFVEHITAGGQEVVVAGALIQIADGLGLSAVAEGVETAEQAQRLHELGYRLAQGYHFARPMPAAEFGEHLAGLAARRAGQSSDRSTASAMAR